MPRLLVAVLVCLCLVSAVSASVTRERPARVEKDLPRAPTVNRAPTNVTAGAQRGTRQADELELIVTRETKVLLNGTRCRYEDVPNHARIVRMELAADRKTALRVFFRTGK